MVITFQILLIIGQKWLGHKFQTSVILVQSEIAKDLNKCTIVLNVVHGKELSVEYEKKNIVDKINSFFGYEFVEKIKLKIIHEKKGYSTYHDKISQDIKRNINNSSKKKINNIENNMLKQSLKDLIRAYENKK